MAKLRYSQEAIQDLEQIGDYIAMELQNPIAALNTVNRIQDRINRLADSPSVGAPLSARYETVGNYRYLVCGSYLAFYREEGEMVFIDRILYGKRDYLKILFGELSEELNRKY